MTKKSQIFSRVLTVVGAGIVLASFVVKDVMREQLKDINDSLNMAENFAYSQVSGIFIQDDLSKMRLEIYNEMLSMNKSGQIPKTLIELYAQQIKMTFQENDRHLKIEGQWVKFLEHSASKIKEEAGRVNEAEAIIAQYSQNFKSTKALEDKSIATFAKVIKNPQDPDVLNYYKDRSRLIAERDKIDSQVTDLTKSILDDLRKSQEKSEREYSWATTASYVFFVFGWVIGLVGQLMGLDDKKEIV